MADFTAGAVLTAAQLDTAFNTFTINAQTGTTYTLGAADAGEMVTVNNDSGGTVTVPTNATTAFETGTHISVLNNGTAGTFTIAGAGGVTLNGDTVTIAPKAAISLVKTATNTWYALAGGALPKASVSSTTGSPTTGNFTDSGTTYDYWKWTGTGSVTFSNTTAGIAEILVLAGGGGSGQTNGGAGGAGGLIRETIYVSSADGTLNITVGAGGAGGASTNAGSPGTYSALGKHYAVGGGRGGGNGTFDNDGGSGGGTDSDVDGSAGVAIAQQGNNGAANSAGGGGGGAGAAGSGTTGGAGVTATWDGTSREYARGGGGNSGIVANTGWGANLSNTTGASGVVILRIAR